LTPDFQGVVRRPFSVQHCRGDQLKLGGVFLLDYEQGRTTSRLRRVTMVVTLRFTVLGTKVTEDKSRHATFATLTLELASLTAWNSERRIFAGARTRTDG